MPKKEVNKLFYEVRKIINDIDPEKLSPGASGGAPEDEYDQEAQKILNYAIHSQENIKINKQLLLDEINRIWKENFGQECPEALLLVSKLLRIIF